MLRLSGSAAHSSFRLDKLTTAAREVLPVLDRITSVFVHFVDVERPLTTEERALLERLLAYGEAPREETAEGRTLLVVPRIGTVTPWSTKATDIAHICGLGDIRRIERGVLYRLVPAAGKDFQDGDLTRVAHLFHDRMTETVLYSAEDADALFSQAEPQP